MGFCFKRRSVAAPLVALAVSLGLQAAPPAPSVRSVVRTDSRTGKLVRTVVVAPPKMVVRKAAAGETLPVTDAVPELIETTAKKYDVDPLLVHSVIQVESAYKSHAVSDKGAQGLMQLMPATARRFGVRNSFDVRDNIEGGVRYLKYLDSLFPNDLRLTLAAYNAGEGAVWKYKNQIPPYRETEEYVQNVGMRSDKAVREAEKRRRPRPEAAAAAPAGPMYAHVEAFVDASGRLHMRTAGQENGGVSTP